MRDELSLSYQRGAARGQLREREVVFLLCLLAAIRVFIFSAAFPFFNNVDEAMHFDLIVKYSQGQMPRGLSNISPESATYLAVFSSNEYWTSSEMIKSGKLPPPSWKQPIDSVRADLSNSRAEWQTHVNYEASMPPLYYTVFGVWLNVGQWLGFKNLSLLYWLRFLNMPLIAATVWLAYVAARMVFPENLFVRLGVSALVAFMPQGTFYSLGNDVLSPLCFGLVFICLLDWLRVEKLSLKLGAATGIAFAATYLAKTTNLPLLAVASAAIMFKCWQWLRQGVKLSSILPGSGAFCACAGAPVLVWTIWCKLHFGDFTGSKLKVDYFGWTLKPLREWTDHPIFSFQGAWIYLSGQLSSYWQGEIIWHDQAMAPLLVGTVFTVLSLALPLVVLVWLCSSMSNVSHRGPLWLSLACFVSVLGFFALMSVMYDFHDSPAPSREHPYFNAGRMMLGSLVPLLLLVVYGFDCLLNKFGNKTKFLSLLALILFISILEITDCWSVFPSQYNWFHL